VRYDIFKMARGRLAPRSTFALALLCACAGTAYAEPSSESIKVARKRFQEGVAAADARNYEAARVAFQQAYALKPHASVLRNLGQAELKTGRYLEAARHLSMFIRDTSFGSAAEREAAKKALVEAEARLGKLLLEVDVVGAEVAIDGELAGRSPLGADPVYVDPGQRIVRIHKEGYEPYEQVQTFEADRAIQLKIALRPVGPLPTEAASVSRVHSSLIDTPTALPVPDRARPAGPSPFPPPGEQRGVEPRTIALLTGVGLTAVATGTGIGFALHGSSLDQDAAALRAEVSEELDGAGCSEATSSASCAKLAEMFDRRNEANAIATGAFIAGGVLGAATVAAFFLWPRSSKMRVPHASIGPANAGSGATLWVVGTY
jgi:hypothetical protein